VIFKPRKVVELATVKYRPTFEICPSNPDGCLIVVIWPKGPEQHLDGFSSVEAAQRWIENDAPHPSKTGALVGIQINPERHMQK
jgi:hypothetical protein